MRTAGLEPLQPYPGSSSVAWLCLCLNCNREVSPSYKTVQQGHAGCRRCAAAVRGKARRIPETEAVELMLKAGVEPLDPYPGSGHKWRCQCKVCGNIVTPRHEGVKREYAACTYCGAAAGGLGAEDDALIYLVTHSGYQAVKIGIGAAHRKRIQQHKKYGWETLEEWSGFNGITAYAAEGAVLRAWRSAGIPAAVTASDMPQAGYTETAPMDLVDLAEVRRIVEQEIKRQAGV